MTMLVSAIPSTLAFVSTSDVPPDPYAMHASTAEELKARLEAERSASSFLGLRDAEGHLQLVLLTAELLRLTIGRHPASDVVIAWDEEVSGVHAELHRISDEWTIVDDGLSKNGTFVNGKRIVGRQRLRDGDRIRVGQTIVRFTSAATASRDATRSAADARRVDELTEAQRQALVALCRPLLLGGDVAVPASNKQVAEELFISEQAVKVRLRQLFDLFGLKYLHQNEKRAMLAQSAIRFGLVSPRDL
jgi:hypothetical protein